MLSIKGMNHLHKRSIWMDGYKSDKSETYYLKGVISVIYTHSIKDHQSYSILQHRVISEQ